MLDSAVLQGVQVKGSTAVQDLLEQEARSWKVDPVRSGSCCSPESSPALDTSPSEVETKSPPAADDARAPLPYEMTPKMFTFREIFAGKARLSQVLSSSSRFMVGNPVEINPNKHVGKSQDTLDDACFKQLLADTKKPNVFFFLSCSIPTGELEGSLVQKGMVVYPEKC